jgi:hypothetical protein
MQYIVMAVCVGATRSPIPLFHPHNVMPFNPIYVQVSLFYCYMALDIP